MVTKAKPIPLDQLVDRFINTVSLISPKTGKQMSPWTVASYTKVMKGLEYFADREGWPEPARLTRQHLRDFILYLSTEPIRWPDNGRRPTGSPANTGTVNRYGTVVKTFLRWALDEGCLPETPELLSLLRFKLPQPSSDGITPYTEEEITTMLRTCQDDIDRGNCCMGVRNRAIISIFTDTGLRLSELTLMKLSELDPKLQQVRVFGKGAKFRVLPINGFARKALKDYLTDYRQPGGDEVWQTDTGMPLTRHGVKIMLARLTKRAGVTSGTGAHKFRHFFGTSYLQNGGDVNTLRLLLGHESLDTTLKYVKFIDKRRAISNHAEFSPLDHLYTGGIRRNDDSWGYGK